MVHHVYLSRVKQPAQSKYPWDHHEVVRTIPGEDAFRATGSGDFPSVAK